jgi:hypothetical protein
MANEVQVGRSPRMETVASSVVGTRELNRSAKRTLRLSQIIQGDDYLGEHSATRLGPTRFYRMSPTRGIAITCFW